MTTPKLVSDNPEIAEFRVPAADNKGHSVRCWFRCIPLIAHQVEQIVQSQSFPYRTNSDLYRHAVHRHLDWLSEQGENVCSLGKQVNVIMTIMRDEERNSEFAEVFTKLTERVNQHLTTGANKEAVRLISEVQRAINGMPDGFWRDRYQKELITKFGGLLETAKRVKLTVVNDDDNE